MQYYEIHYYLFVLGISIQVLGFAKTFWDRTIVCSCKLNCIKRDHSTYYDHSGREEYMSKHIYLLGSPDGKFLFNHSRKLDYFIGDPINFSYSSRILFGASQI